MTTRPIRFATIGLDHGAYQQNNQLLAGGFELVSFWATVPEQIAKFSQTYPQAKLARRMDEILEDHSIDLINCASINSERAAIGIAAMQHGKDFLVGKPGPITLERLAATRRVQAETKRKYIITCPERLENKPTVKAGELVEAGAIGKVLQTVGIGPHQLNHFPREPWFYKKEKFGGILVDIGAHQFDQFLFFTGSTQAEILSSQIGNLNHPEHPELEDFGDVSLRGNGGLGYARLDWHSPDALGTWGDLRLFVLGTEGYIEVRKMIDIGGHQGYLFLVNKEGIRQIDCQDQELPFVRQLAADIADRTETAMTQDHSFLVAELSLKAEAQATRLGYLPAPA